MTLRALARRLRRSRGGSVAVEFALLGPMMIALLLGVLQVGLAMQSYNALRGIAADVGRHVAVEYQRDNELTNADIQLYGTGIAVNAPYMLDSERVTVEVEDAATQRIAGAREITFTVTYSLGNLLSFIDVPDMTIDFSRPIFVEA